LLYVRANQEKTSRVIASKNRLRNGHIRGAAVLVME